MVGYVNPSLEEVELSGRTDDLPEKILAGLAAIVGEFMENPQTETFATKVPFDGDLNNVDTGVWTAVATVFRK